MDPSSCASVWIEAINASSIISGSPVAEEVLSVEPEGDGCLEVASAARLLLPGRCVMSKRHGRVRCFSRNKREFDISSSVRSPKIFTSGLWSVTTTKLSHPWVKYRVCSSPQATSPQADWMFSSTFGPGNSYSEDK